MSQPNCIEVLLLLQLLLILLLLSLLLLLLLQFMVLLRPCMLLPSYYIQLQPINVNLSLVKLIICCCCCKCCCGCGPACCYWSHYIQLWSFNVNLELLRATIEFVWWGGVGGLCTVIFMPNPTSMLRLGCGCVVLLLGL